MFEKNQKKVLNAWCMYDWANSVHNLVITTVVFPMYFLSTAVNEDGGVVICFFWVITICTVCSCQYSTSNVQSWEVIIIVKK